jgi:ABC-type sugar transport system ATPase subunit
LGSVEFRGITKYFPGIKALDDVSFTAQGGEVAALLGENGAGKSTLLKILNGEYGADSGQILIDGVERRFRSPREAINAGISVIYQERQIVPDLTVAENIFMEELPVGPLGFVDFKALNKAARAILDEFHLPVRPAEQVRRLSVAHQQMVEIMKAYRRKPKIIAFDEPTASLSDHEIESLFQIIRQLQKRGIIILYVSHRMREIFQITDQVIVLKDGRFIAKLPARGTDEGELIRLMVGRDLGDVFNKLSRNAEFGEVVLEAKGLVNEHVRGVSFTLRKGEILGFCGLVGAGRTETMRALYGADRLQEGEVLIEGKKASIKSVRGAIKLGLGLCPEDRKEEGIFGCHTVRENISVAALEKVSYGQFISRGLEIGMAWRGVENLRISTPDIEKSIRELSGGNQQKTILARWLAAEPKVLILDEPTKGIDVGSKSEIYQMACDLAKSGIGVILVSSELPEVLGLSDRIIVMRDGRVAGEVNAREATEESLLTLAMAEGVRRDEENAVQCG